MEKKPSFYWMNTICGWRNHDRNYQSEQGVDFFRLKSSNNLEIVTTTSKKYATHFGVTEAEVFAALEKFGMGSEKEPCNICAVEETECTCRYVATQKK